MWGPSGLSLEPLLFIALANDLCNASEILFYILYADDSAVLLIKGKGTQRASCYLV